MIGVKCGSAAVLAVFAALAAGCTSSTAGHGTPPAVTSTPAGGAPGTGSAAPTTPVATPPTAADGENVAACADGRCEVRVRAGVSLPVPASMRVRDVRVSAVGADRVTVTGHDTGNSGGGLCTGNCDSSSTNGAFTIRLGADSRATENGFAVTVVSLTDGAAVLRIEPAG